MNRLAVASVLAFLFTTLTARADEPKPLLRDFLGINGHTISFNPALYSPLCRLVRDYHPYQWDVDNKPGSPTHFPVGIELGWKDKTGKFRDWPGPIDWQVLYTQWENGGFEIDDCLQFDGVPVSKWPDVEKNTYDYAKAYASYCGPSHHKLVSSAEIGNEPAGNKQYSAEQYKLVLRSMSRGLREGDPKLKIVSCAVQAGKPDGYCEPIDVLKGESKSYDIINLHRYAFLAGWPSFERTYPENEKANFGGLLQQSIDWRNQNAPGKPIWLTEFGFDSSTKPPDAKNAKWKGCTDRQQAQWIVRSFLVMSGLDLARAYLYFFDDNDQPSLHASSGVTRHYDPKPSYFAMRHLYRSLGDYRFAEAVEKKPDDAYVFRFTNSKTATKQVIVAWLPTGSDQTADKVLKIPGKLIKAERMPLTDGEKSAVDVTVDQNGTARVMLTESPLYLWIAR